MPLSANEQYLLELINRARLDPTGEAAIYGLSDLNRGLPAGTITVTAKQPLAPNELLNTAARNHSQWMLDFDQFSHTGAGGSTPGQRMEAAGYTFTGSWTRGENIAWSGQSSGLNFNAQIDVHHEGLFLSDGHRKNLLNADYREIGLGQVRGNFTDSGFVWDSSMLTENFARSGTVLFVTGVAYTDANANGRYSIGEGAGGTGVSSSLAGSTTTSVTGGYALGVANGNHRITFGSAQVDVQVNGENVKLDLVGSSEIASSVSMTLVSGVQHGTLLGVGNLTLTGNGSAERLTGNKGHNRLEGMGGNDSISGLGGNDTLLGGAGNDTLIGGDGFDTADYSGAGTPVSVILYGNQVFGVDSGNDSVAGIEHIIGTAGADLMYGDDGANRFEGGLGEDTLDGGGGDDTLIGGEGADLLNGLAGADSLDGGNGNDSLYGWADNDSLIGAEGDDRLYGGAGADSLDGGTGADQLEGDDGNDTLVGGVGADTLRGWNDNDSLDGGDDGDALFGGAGADTLLGAGGDDQIEGDDGNDSLAGGTGADTLRGWNDNDTLDGGEGNDALYGGAGLDSMLGGLGNDVLEGDDGADTLAGGDGADTLRGWNDNDNLDGGEGNDLLVGWSGNDSMSGGAGDDQLFGDDGADTLDGGAGGDVLQGGLGNDLYRFAADFGFDGVRDYDYIAGNNDTFHFSSHNIGDLSFARVGDALKVTHTANSANTLYVNDWYQAGSAGAFKIETWTMANGSSFTAAQIEALVTP